MTVAAQAADQRPRPLRSLLSALFAVALIALASAALKGWRDYSGVQTRERALAAEIAATETRILELERRIERLQRDPVTLDRVAREELGLVRPEEVVIVLPEAAPSRQTPANGWR